MKGYVYITGNGADPARDGGLKDPILSAPVPTLGACMPHIRHRVQIGDWIFVVSGKAHGVQQYVVGGLQVQEKITALAAYKRFPENRLRKDKDGRLVGNIIVRPDGSQHPLDTHPERSFSNRIEDYIVGAKGIAVGTPSAVDLSRTETLGALGRMFGRPGANRVVDVLGRGGRGLNEEQVEAMLRWLNRIAAG